MKDHLVKLVLLILAVVVVFFVWFGLRTIDNQVTKIDKLENKIEKQKSHIAFLEENNMQKDKDFSDSENKKIESAATVFIKTFYHVKKGNFEERKKDAEVILTQEMFNKFFHEKEEELLYENELDHDVRIYTNFSNEKGSAIAVFDNTMINTANHEKDRYKTTVEIFLIKNGNNWRVENFEQLLAEPL